MFPLFSPFVFLVLIVGPFFLLSSAFTAKFDPEELTVEMHKTAIVKLTLDELPILTSGSYIHITSDDGQLAEVSKVIHPSEINASGNWNGDFEVYAIFLGTPKVFVELVVLNITSERADETLTVTIIRENRAIDHAFTGSVIVLVALLYINFGAALDLTKLKGIIKKPIGPVIGFCGQFIVMPLLGFGLGSLIFPKNVALQLGMFFTGCSPAGGASNIWTIILGGNMDLSIAMTSLSTLLAFAMMPLWLFTLGKVIFERDQMEVPYSNLATYVAALFIPLALGFLIQRYLPRVRNILVRILKPLSVLLILFIVIFAIVTNLYLFELFSWQIVVAGMGLPWLGYVLGYLAAGICRQNHKDRLAIALETGVQNTGISIFLLRFALPQPQADLTTVVPVSVAIMTPVPLICLYIGQIIYRWFFPTKVQKLPVNEEGTNGIINDGENLGVSSDNSKGHDRDNSKD